MKGCLSKVREQDFESVEKEGFHSVTSGFGPDLALVPITARKLSAYIQMKYHLRACRKGTGFLRNNKWKLWNLSMGLDIGKYINCWVPCKA